MGDFATRPRRPPIQAPFGRRGRFTTWPPGGRFRSLRSRPARRWQADTSRSGFAAAVRWLALDAIAPLLGAIVGTKIAITEQGLGYLLAVYAGFFLFMGATDLLPEAHQHASGRRVALTVLGFTVTAGIAYAASR